MSSFQQIFGLRPGGAGEPETEEQPEWTGPPDDALGEAVPLGAAKRSQRLWPD